MSNSYVPMHPRLRALLELTDLFAEAAEAGARQLARAARPRRPGGVSRTPGPDTPFWNTLASEIRVALRPKRAKVRLARYLGIPRQRVSEFFSSRTRIPDAELTLQIVHWYVDLARTRRDRTL